MRLLKVVAVAMSLVALTAIAQESGTVVATARHAEHGVHLVDGDGLTLYMNSLDTKDTVACVDACLEGWAPYAAEGQVTAGQGVAPNLLGTISRPDGVEQVTYFGVPLYRYGGDAAPGDVNGFGLADQWFLINPFGAAIQPPAQPEPTEATGGAGDLGHMDLAMVMGVGQEVYNNFCSACHGNRGQGGAGPALAGGRLEDNRRVIRQVIFGGGHMPPFGGALNDEQVAGVVTFIRKSWGNDFAAVTAEEVSTYR
jgi:predicted lipoprotein with Yx(FWY)xxD motif/mono/diheme cytochrome c family protein